MIFMFFFGGVFSPVILFSRVFLSSHLILQGFSLSIILTSSHRLIITLFLSLSSLTVSFQISFYSSLHPYHICPWAVYGSCLQKAYHHFKFFCGSLSFLHHFGLASKTQTKAIYHCRNTTSTRYSGPVFTFLYSNCLEIFHVYIYHNCR